MSMGQTFYNIFLKRTSSFILTVSVGAFLFERSFDVFTTAVWENNNKGKLWKDIKHNYEK